jgi:hypothetical protein
MLGMTRKAVYLRIEGSPELAESLHDAREMGLDLGEAALFKAIDRGEAWAICFYLKTQGKQRGYIEKAEHNHTGTMAVVGLTIQQVMAELEKDDSLLDAFRAVCPSGHPALPGQTFIEGQVAVGKAPAGHRPGGNGRAKGNGATDHHG